MQTKIVNHKLQKTSHGVGRKRILVDGKETNTSLTQFAYGELEPSEIIEDHIHPTMEEVFYFISGEGTFIINENNIKISGGLCIRVPENTVHSMNCSGTQILTYVYYGIQIAD